MKLRLGVVCAVVLVSAVLAAGGGITTGGAATAKSPGTNAGDPTKAACKGKKIKLGFAAPLPDPNYLLIYKLIAADLKKAGGTSQFTQASLDSNKQIADVASMISSGANVLIVAPVNPQSIQPALNAARQKKAKLVETDVFIGGPYATNVATSPYDSGYQAALYMKKKLGNGQVAGIMAPTFAGPVIAARNAGFLAGAEKAKLNLVDTPTAPGFSPDAGAQLISSFKVKYGSSLKGIWVFNDVLALGAPQLAGGGFDPQIFGDNGDPAMIGLIKGGKAAATWNLHPEAIAHTLAWSVERAVCGKSLPKTVYVPVTRVDRSNVSKWVPWEKLTSERFFVRLEKKGKKTFVKVYHP